MNLKLIKKGDLQNNVLRVVISLSILVGLVWLVRAGLTLIEPSRAYKVEGQLPVAARASTLPSQNSAQFDPNFDPFHRGDAGVVNDAPAVSLIGEGAPETDLNLELIGRRAYEGGGGSAILKLPDGIETHFAQGDLILRNVTLEAVYDSHIIISRNGVHERVTFQRERGSLFQSGFQSDDINAEAPAKAVITAAAVKDQTVVLKEDVKAKFSDLTTEEVMRKLRFSPVKEGSKIKGYRLQVRDRSFDLSEVGYQKGDLVTHISGQDLRQGRPEFELIFKQIEQNPSAAVLTIDRNGDALNLSLN
ncbi:MAG: type II secretion system protein N [Maricaulaceae bacterium]